MTCTANITQSRAAGSDPLTAEIDVLDRMRGPIFADARTTAGFAKVAVDAETGTLVWHSGADLAPDTLYVRSQTGAWPGQPIAA